MKQIRRIETGHYNRVYEVEYHGKVAIAKFRKPVTALTTNIDVFLGNILLGDWRSYSTPASRQRYEMDKLESLYERGAAVPPILERGDDYFVMEKLEGDTLDKKLGDEEVIRWVFQELGNLHTEFRVYHGSPHPRNILVNSREIFWVDWETRLKNHSLQRNQERDTRIVCEDLRKRGVPAGLILDVMQGAYPKGMGTAYQKGMVTQTA